MSVLTDEEGKQQYCAVHSFSEPISSSSPTHQHRTLRRGRSSTVVKRSNSEGEVIENGLTDNSAVDEYIDEDMFRVANEDMDSQPISSDESKKDLKYAPKCLVLLSRVNDFRVLKVGQAM